MNNPCSECIVTPMCTKPCDALEKYLDNYLAKFSRFKEHTTCAISRALRQGVIEIYNNNNRGWRYVGVWKNYEKISSKHGVQI